jgi:hypothetical protein
MWPWPRVVSKPPGKVFDDSSHHLNNDRERGRVLVPPRVRSGARGRHITPPCLATLTRLHQARQQLGECSRLAGLSRTPQRPVWLVPPIFLHLDNGAFVCSTIIERYALSAQDQAGPGMDRPG